MVPYVLYIPPCISCFKISEVQSAFPTCTSLHLPILTQVICRRFCSCYEWACGKLHRRWGALFTTFFHGFPLFIASPFLNKKRPGECTQQFQQLTFFTRTMMLSYQTFSMPCRLSKCFQERIHLQRRKRWSSWFLPFKLLRGNVTGVKLEKKWKNKKHHVRGHVGCTNRSIDRFL